MSGEGEPDLRLVVHMLRQGINEQASVRDDLNVLSANLMRLDSSVGVLLTELRAMHSQHSRGSNRVRDLEATVNEGLAP